MSKPLCYVLLVTCLLTGPHAKVRVPFEILRIRGPNIPKPQAKRSSRLVRSYSLILGYQEADAQRAPPVTIQTLLMGIRGQLASQIMGNRGYVMPRPSLTLAFGRTSCGTVASVHLRNRPSVLSEWMAKWG